MSDFLAAMRHSSAGRASIARSRRALLEAMAGGRASPLSLTTGGFGLIAEAKLRSPSMGRLVPEGDDRATVISLVKQFSDNGAAAISVLTEPTRFDGALDHLEAVADSIELPVLCKDFLVEPIQVLEARAHGASGVLLIVRMLGPDRLGEMVDEAHQLGMFVLIEVFDEADLEIATQFEGDGVLIGVNSRNLADLSVEFGRLETLSRRADHRVPWVAESGVAGPGDVTRLAEWGYDFALVGTAAVRSDDPGRFLRDLTSGAVRKAGSGSK